MNYSYNGMGEITEINQHLITWTGYNDATNTVAYSYDNTARLKTITYPGGAIVSYGYDVTGQINRVDLDQDGIITNLLDVATRFPFGTINTATLGNGQSYFSYVHNDYRTWVIAAAGQYTTISYDRNGNPAIMYYPQGQGALSYDALQRLDTSTGSLGNFDYDYDPVGNKTRQVQDSVSTSMSYDVSSNRMNTLDNAAVNVDANGNTIGLRGMTLNFTSDNRLKNINTGVAFEYDGLGQRAMKKTTSPGYAGTLGYSQTKTYLYGKNGELLAETGPTGKVSKEYIYLEGKPLAMLTHTPSSSEDFLNADMDGDGAISIEDFLVYYFNYRNSTDPAYDLNGDGVKDAADNSVAISCGLTPGSCDAVSYSTSLYYIHNDHLGTPKALTNESGTMVWQATATPFGKATVNNDVDGDGVAVEMNLRQPGQYYDRESGFYYNYYRYYDPETGRYITSDPIGLWGGINTYAYVENNPLNWIDPLGLNRTNRGRHPAQSAGSIARNGPTLRNDFSRERQSRESAREFLDRMQRRPDPVREPSTNRDARDFMDNLSDMLPDPSSVRDYLDKNFPTPGCKWSCNQSSSNMCTANDNGKSMCKLVCQ